MVRRLLAAVFLGGGMVSPLWAADEAVKEPVVLFLSATRRATPMAKTPTNVSVITTDQIRRSNAKTLDEVLSLEPSMDVQKTGSLGTFATVRMRGVPSSAHVQIVVDDQPLGGVAHQYLDISQFPVDNIERVEIVRGGSSVLYGANTTGGVIHIITKRQTGEKPASSVGMHLRSYPTEKGLWRRWPVHIYSADLGAKGRRWDGYINASRWWTKGFQHNEDGGNVSVAGNGGYTFQNGARLTLDAARTDNDMGDPQGTLIPPTRWNNARERKAADPNQRVAKNINTSRLRLASPLGAAGSFQTQWYGSDEQYKLFPNINAAPIVNRDTVLLGNDTRFLLPWGFTLGGSYERDVQVNHGGGNAYHVASGGAYLQDELSLGKWTFVPAVRRDWNSAFGQATNPRFTLVWRAAPTLKLSANASRSYRAPSFMELFYESAFFNGNPELSPEIARTYDFGFEAGGRKARLGATGFFTRLKDRISATATTFENRPRAEMSGVETAAALNLGPLAARANHTYLRALGNTATTVKYRPLRLTPRHMANIEAVWHAHNKWEITNTVQYFHSQYQFDGEAGRKLPSRTLWHVRVAKRLLTAEVYGALENVLNKHYAETFGNDPLTFATTWYPQPGQTFRCGITARFTD